MHLRIIKMNPDARSGRQKWFECGQPIPEHRQPYGMGERVEIMPETLLTVEWRVEVDESNSAPKRGESGVGRKCSNGVSGVSMDQQVAVGGLRRAIAYATGEL
jgi:hypothetical protein